MEKLAKRFPSKRMIESYRKLTELEIPQEKRSLLMKCKYGVIKTFLFANDFEDALECIQDENSRGKNLKGKEALEEIENYIINIPKIKSMEYLIGFYNGISKIQR